MREAPAIVVAAVMGWHGCERVMPGNYCSEHCNRWKERGCGTAVGAADAAWAVAYPAALRGAAARLDWVKPDVCPCDHPEACCGSEEACDAMQPSVRVIGASDLRIWADESEADHHG